MASVFDHINKAQAYKEEGNKHFKANEFGQAMFQYHLGTLELKAIFSQIESGQLIAPGSARDTEGDEEANALYVILQSNLGMCNLKEGRPDRAVKACSEALKKDPKHQKSLYRRGRAYMEKSEVHDLVKARADLEEALSLSPKDQPTLTLLQRLEKMEAVEDKEMQKQYAKMFA